MIGLSLLMASTAGLLTPPGILLCAAVLILVPLVMHSLGPNADRHEKVVLASILGPLTYINFLYALRVGAPVGFIDVHVHLFQTKTIFNDAGFVDFARVHAVSFDFVGLYVLARSLALVSSVDLATVAVALPPFTNITFLLIAYATFRRLLPKNVSQLALTFLGWENVVILYGAGFITQTPAFLMLFVGVYCFVARRSATSPTGLTIATSTALIGLATFSFSSAILGLILFVAIGVFEVARRSHRYKQAFSCAMLLSIFFLGYSIYISSSPASVFGTIAELIREALSAQVAVAPNVGQQLYGSFVRGYTYAFWALFVIAFPFFLASRDAKSNLPVVPVFLSCGLILVLGVMLNNTLNFSLGRTYQIGLILIAVVVASGLVRVAWRMHGNMHRAAKVLVCVIVIMYAATSVAKFPSYIGGNTAPLRGSEPIDAVPYWWTGARDFSAARFLETYDRGAIVHPSMIIERYMILDACSQDVRCINGTFGPDGRLVLTTVRPGEQVLLENAFHGEAYTYRNLLPPSNYFSSYSVLFDNGDYVLYLARDSSVS